MNTTTAATNGNYYYVVTSGTVQNSGFYKFTPYPGPNTAPQTITVPYSSNTTFTWTYLCATCDEPLEPGEQTICKKCKKVIKAMRAIVVEDEDEKEKS